MTWIEVTVQLVLFSLTFASVIYFRQPKKNNYLMDFEKEIRGEFPLCESFCNNKGVASNKEVTTETIQQNILTRIEKKTNQKVSDNRFGVKAKVENEINKEELMAQLSLYKFP